METEASDLESDGNMQSAPSKSLASVKIRAFRHANDLSALELGAKLGVSQTAVLFWEYGQRAPRLEMQGKLKVLGVCDADDWHKPAPPDSPDTDGTGEGDIKSAA